MWRWNQYAADARDPAEAQFLDGDLTMEPTVFGCIRDAEPAPAEHPPDLEPSMLTGRRRTEARWTLRR